jgi:hypothetical protein
VDAAVPGALRKKHGGQVVIATNKNKHGLFTPCRLPSLVLQQPKDRLSCFSEMKDANKLLLAAFLGTL